MNPTYPSGGIAAEGLIYTVEEGGRKRNILDGISCDIPEGALTTIGGPSGSGKTTFMYALAGLLQLSGGSVRYGTNVSIYDMKPKQRDAFRLERIGFIYQHLNLFGFLNVEENITLNYALRGKPVTPEVDARIDAYLEVMKLGPIRKKEIGALSGGEKQRVSIIRAFISDAPYIFADEPTGNLDRENSVLFMDCLKDMIGTNRSTVVLVTHESEIKAYGDRQITIVDGRIAEQTMGIGRRQNG
ncbi:ABC transporter [Saccharibacillus sp. O23]|uniref:ABC transporter ATP-binding protein n=1 Tax=Saccharibacillus sp. O23 TaxID=2009338 RepID=UPI000B4E00F4|nr:ABC transporter ATP-binding protein [Saccharibacillus sp. O23]OWR33184.1 ABC transporter [Saccharibacillus sp. O23]